MMKNQKGITLIALTVTIIIMAILAAVTLNNVLGDEGIINKINKVTLDQKAKSAQEEVMSAVASLEYYELASGDRGSQLKSLMNSNNLQKYLTGRVNGFIVNGDTTTVYYTNDDGSFTITIKYPGKASARDGIYVINNANSNKLNTVEMDKGEKLVFTSDKKRQWAIVDSETNSIVNESKATIDVLSGELIYKEKGNYKVIGYAVLDNGDLDTSDYVEVNVVEKQKPFHNIIVGMGDIHTDTVAFVSKDNNVNSNQNTIEMGKNDKVTLINDEGYKYWKVTDKEGNTVDETKITVDDATGIVECKERGEYILQGYKNEEDKDKEDITDYITVNIIEKEEVITVVAEFEVGTNVVAQVKSDDTMHICKKEGVIGDIDWELSPEYLSNGITFDGIVKLNGTSETSIVGIVVEEGIKTIPDNSFNKYTEVTTLSLPASLKSLGNIIPSKEEGLYNMTTLYYNCKSLTSIAMLDERALLGKRDFYIPVADWPTYDISDSEWSTGYVVEDTVWHYYYLSLFYNSKLTNVIFGETVETLPNNIFICCLNIAKIELPSSLKSMGENVFAFCTDLKELVIPEGNLTTISKEAFRDCGIETIDIPSNISTIGTWSFKGCSLKAINIPGTVRTISQGAFAYCSEAKSITINEGTQLIDREAFEYCFKVSNINFNVTSSLKQIGSLSFANICMVENVQIPDCVNLMSAAAFYKNRHLKTLKFPKNLSNYVHVSYCEELENIIWPEVDFNLCLQGFMGNNHFTELTLPDNCVGIEYNAFKDSPNLKTINLGQRTKVIGERAFWNCTALTTVNLNEGLEEIKTTAFIGCTALQQITIPSTVTEMGEDVFKECKKINRINLLSPSTSVLNNDLKPWMLNHTQSINIYWSDGVTETF